MFGSFEEEVAAGVGDGVGSPDIDEALDETEALVEEGLLVASDAEGEHASGAASASASALASGQEPSAKKQKTTAASAGAGSASAAAPRQKAKGKAGSGRTLKRKTSNGCPGDLLCEARLCLWGGQIKAPAVIHPLIRRKPPAGEEWKHYFPLHERLFWLRRACGEKGQTHWTERFQHAVSTLRAALRDEIAQKVDPARTAAERLRDSLGLEDDEQPDSGPPSGQTKRRLKLPASTEEVVVPLAGASITVRLHERPFEILATPEAVMAVVKFCRERLEDDPIILKRDEKRATAEANPSGNDDAPADSPAQASAQEGRAPQAASAPAKSATTKGAFSFAAAACPAILGKVTWHPSVKAWAVHFKDSAKKAQTKRVPVRVPKDTGSGAFLTSDGAALGQAWAQARRSAYEEAISLWNRLDRSTRDRIELDEAPGSPAAAASAPASASGQASST